MSELQDDRRALHRFPFHLPVIVKHPVEGEIATQTRDLSSRGICFYLQSPLYVGSTLQLTLTLPSEITQFEPVRVRCFARVVRVEQDSGGGTTAGVVVVNHYEFLKAPLETGALQAAVAG